MVNSRTCAVTHALRHQTATSRRDLDKPQLDTHSNGFCCQAFGWTRNRRRSALDLGLELIECDMARSIHINASEKSVKLASLELGKPETGKERDKAIVLDHKLDVKLRRVSGTAQPAHLSQTQNWRVWALFSATVAGRNPKSA